MNIFEEEFRKICTRGITLTKQQMETFRIKQIFNSFGDPDFLNAEQAEDLLKNHIANGDFCLLEVASSNTLYIISLITFEDIWSRNVYAIKNMDYYNGFPDLITIYN
jgi:hypothetical protein